MINVGVAKLACRDRLRSRDVKGRIKEEEEEEEDEDDYDDEDDQDDHDDDEEEERENKKVRKWKASPAVLEKKRMKLPINLEKEDVEVLDKKAKNKGEKRIHGGDDKTKHRKTFTTNFVGEKNKKSSSHGREHKIQSGDHDKDKGRSTLLSLDKNKDSLKEKSRKLSTTHSAEKKLRSSDHHKDKRKGMHTNSKNFEKKKILSSPNGEHKVRGYDYGQHKGWSELHLFNNNEMQKNEMKKKKNTPLDLSKENKIQMTINNKKEIKRKNTTEIFNNGKKMRTKDKDEKAWSGDRWKLKNTTQGYNKEQKVQSAHKEERNVPITFIKLVYNNNFKEFLLIPPVVTPKLKDLTNRHVTLKDSEGKFSRVRLSMVDGSLAFYEGWDKFVSDHSIKLGDFLLFECTASSHFSVRVFGMDSCERVCFSVERQGGKKQKGCHPPDETENASKSMNAASGARSVAGNSKEDPNRVVSWVEHGSSIALKEQGNDIFQTWTKGTRSSELIVIDDEAPLTQENEDTEKLKTLHAASETHCVTANTEEDPKGVASGALCGPSVALDDTEGTLAIGECKTNRISSICSTEKTVRSEIIPVIDAAPLAKEYEDTEKLKTLHAASETHCVTANTEEDPKGVASGALCGPSVALDDMEGTLAFGECKTNRISSICSTEKTVRSEIIPVTGAAPLAKEYDDAVELKTFPLHFVENTSMVKESEPEIATSAKCTEIQDSEEDLKMKQEGNTVQLECTTAVGKCPNISKMNTNGNVFSKYEAPGGSPSLEKWKKATVSGQTALDVTELIKPEKLLKTEDKLVGNCSSVGVNSSEQSLQGYAGRAALDGTGLIRPEKRLKTDDKLVGNCSAMGVNPVERLSRGYAGTHSCVQQTPGKISESVNIKTEIDLLVNGKGERVPEKRLKTDDKLVGNCSATGVNPVEQSSRGYAGTHSCVQQTIGKISKSRNIKTEIDLLVNGKGERVPEKRLKTDDKLVGNCSATGVNPVVYAGTHSCVQQTPGKISKYINIKTEIDLVSGKGPTVQPKTQVEQFEPMGSISCRQQLNNIPVRADHAVARLSEHQSFNQEDRKASHHVTPAVLLPVKVEVSKLDDHSVLKTNLQFCIPSTTQTWLELPSSLSKACRRKGRQDRNIVMLKDPLRRLWPVFYHEHSLFVGFTSGWKPFVTANNLQAGDVCLLLKDLDEDELVYHVQITRK